VPCVLLVLVLLAPAAWAQEDEERLAFFPADPVTVAMKTKGEGQEGAFTVVVTNSGPLMVTRLPGTAAAEDPLGEYLDPFPTTGATLVKRGKRPPEIERREMRRLTLYLRTPAEPERPPPERSRSSPRTAPCPRRC
jgi:hypothetical protein